MKSQRTVVLLEGSGISHDPVLSALMKKRSELDARHATLARQLAQVEADIAHINGAIGLFNPAPHGRTPEKIKRASLIGLLNLERGELTSLTLNVVRVAKEPLTSKEVAHAVCERQGIARDMSLIDRLAGLVTGALRRHLRTGDVIKVGQTSTKALLWSAPVSSKPSGDTRL